MEVWIAGRTKDEKVEAWAFIGVFSSADAAEAACRAEGEHHGTTSVWYAPVKLDVAAPLNDRELPDATFPLLKDVP